MTVRRGCAQRSWRVGEKWEVADEPVTSTASATPIFCARVRLLVVGFA